MEPLWKDIRRVVELESLNRMHPKTPTLPGCRRSANPRCRKQPGDNLERH